LLFVLYNQIESDYNVIKNAGSDSINKGEEKEIINSENGNNRNQKEGNKAEISINIINIRESLKNIAGNTFLYKNSGGILI